MSSTAFATLAVYTRRLSKSQAFPSCPPSLSICERAPQGHDPRLPSTKSRTQSRAYPNPFGLDWLRYIRGWRVPSLDRCVGVSISLISRTMDRKLEGSRAQSACRHCIESNSPCNGQIPCHRCGHYSLNCVYLSRAHPTCLECSRNISECDGDTPCQRCRQRTLQCVYSSQVEMDYRANAPAVVASQSEEAWPERNPFRSRSRDMETRPMASGARMGGREGGLGARDPRHETREPDSFFIKEHNKGIDEDHLAKFKPDKKEWKTDRTL